jgi:hypothetical protein
MTAAGDRRAHQLSRPLKTARRQQKGSDHPASISRRRPRRFDLTRIAEDLGAHSTIEGGTDRSEDLARADLSQSAATSTT